ncbi:MAG: glycine--tRNA ligase subunit beta [Rhodospirillales bacterium]
MAELLLELLSEEIPARMQARAAEDLKRLVTEKLTAAGLAFAEAYAFVTPRRLALAVKGLPQRTADLEEEKKGPRVGSPDQAIQGFLRGAGLAGLEQCEKRVVGKAEFWFAVTKRKGVETAAVLPGLLVDAIEALPWPKSMRFADAQFRWVRPLQSILAVFDGKGLQGALKRGGALAPLAFDDGTVGHRFLCPQPFKAARFAEYRRRLRVAQVILDREERKGIVERELHRLAAAHGLRLKEDMGLLEEVAGLVEWPAVLVGTVDPRYAGLPPEILSTAMRRHQKYFTLTQRDGKVTHFAVVANMPNDPARDRTIVAGNERVLRARLSDAQFFWEQDKKLKLADRLPALKEVVFHAKLGSVFDKARRIEALAGELAKSIPGCDSAQAKQAAHLAKTDLVSGVVGEFPELQGVMGRYLALNERLPPAVADAIAEHYSPLGPNDRCPTAPVSVAVALADKLDSLAGFFAIGEQPTGSKDPFALRRAALGVIRLIVENKLRLKLRGAFATALKAHAVQIKDEAALIAELLDFIADRLKVIKKDEGVRHDYIAAVFALGGQDDLVDLLARVEWLERFLSDADGQNLLIAYRRAANILRIEEKKDGKKYSGIPDSHALMLKQELELFDHLNGLVKHNEAAIAKEDYLNAMTELAGLRPLVDAFFDKVTVNADDAKLRENRLKLLSRIQATMDQVAIFAKIEG